MAAAEHITEIAPGVTAGETVMHGKPVIVGTRVPVSLIVSQLAGGESMEAVGEAYDLTEAQIRAALGYAAQILSEETVYPVQSDA